MFSSIGYTPYATSLFVFAIKHPKIHCKPMEYLGSDLSLWNYIFHVPISYVVATIAGMVTHIDTEMGIYPILTVVATVIFSYSFNLILKKIRNAFIEGVYFKGLWNY